MQTPIQNEIVIIDHALLVSATFFLTDRQCMKHCLCLQGVGMGLPSAPMRGGKRGGEGYKKE